MANAKCEKPPRGGFFIGGIRGYLQRLALLHVLSYDVCMTKVLEDAIAKVRKLPEDRQAYIAEVLEQFAAAGDAPFAVPEDHRAAVLEGLRQAERGEFASDEEMAALWKKSGL
jgi:predicted transcriptional regulator